MGPGGQYEGRHKIEDPGHEEAVPGFRAQRVEEQGHGDRHQLHGGGQLAQGRRPEPGRVEVAGRHQRHQRDDHVPADGEDRDPGGDADRQVTDGHGQQHEGGGHQQLVGGGIQHGSHGGLLVEPPRHVAVQHVREARRREDDTGLHAVAVPDRDGEHRNGQDPEQRQDVGKGQVHGLRVIVSSSGHPEQGLVTEIPRIALPGPGTHVNWEWS